MSTAVTPRQREQASGDATLAPRQPRPVGQLLALDGIRGAGMVIVLLYHHNVSWVPGGVLTVSMFFTLSGYLITRLLINERDRSGRVSLRRFWDRRVRRLMPASALVIATVALLNWWFPNGHRPLGFRDVLASSTYWQNIHLATSGSNYADVNGISSPLIHMWSLSLEEQVYVFFPLMMLGVLAIPAVRRRAGTVLMIIATAGFALGPYLQRHHGTSVAYYATPVRVAEFLVGAALACWWSSSAHVETLLRVLRTWPLQAVSLALLAAEVWLWWKVGLVTTWTFPWGLAINAAVVAVIMAYSEAGGAMTKLLGFPPFMWAGVRVYGIYLIHWPVFRFLTAQNTHLSFWWLFVVRVAVTLVLAETLYRLVEDPVRRKKMWQGATAYVASASIFAVALFAGWMGRHVVADRAVNLDYIAMQHENLLGMPEAAADAPTRSATFPDLPARVLFEGDSQSFSVGSGMQPWGAEHGVDVRFNAGVGCGIGGVTTLQYLGVDKSEQEGCAAWVETRQKIIQRFRPQLVVIVGGLADLSDRKIDGRWMHIGQPEYDTWLEGQMRSFLAEATTAGARVLWLTIPDVRVPYQAGATGQPPFKENDPQRAARYNELIRRVGDADPAVTVAEFASAVAGLPGGQFNPDVRPDGSHIDMSKAPSLVSFVAAAIADATH